MAHCIAIASHAMEFAPCALILLDPPPLDAPANATAHGQVTLRGAARGLLSVLLATASEMSEREAKQEQVDQLLRAEMTAWIDEEIAIHTTQRLAQAGVRQLTFEAVQYTMRQIRAFADGANFLQASREARTTPVNSRHLCPWKIFLMVAKDRVPFYSKIGSSLEEASTVAAHQYGNVILEMECDAAGGGHFAETISCATGENKEFVMKLRSFCDESFLSHCGGGVEPALGSEQT